MILPLYLAVILNFCAWHKMERVLMNSTAFAPSELVLLHGDQFAKKGRLGNSKLLHTTADVSTEELARAILAAALLSVEQVGSVRLEVQEKKAWLGLRTVQTIYVEPQSADFTWPKGSLESRIYEVADFGRLGKPKHEVAHIVSELIGEDSTNPWGMVIERVKAGLAARELLEISEKKTLRVFTTREYLLPDAVRAQAAAQEVAPLHQLLRGAEQKRPDVWRLMQEHIRTAIGWRTERDDDNDFDFD